MALRDESVSGAGAGVERWPAAAETDGHSHNETSKPTGSKVLLLVVGLARNTRLL